MSSCKITVLRKMLNTDLAEEYCESEVGPCPCFQEGQEFVAGFEKPQDFCDWAWNDIHEYVAVLLSGGNFSRDAFKGWMKEKNTMIASCTDGIRPIVFKIERVDK